MNIVSKIKIWKKEQETMKELRALSDRELEDIGINRYDIKEIVKEA